MRHFTPSTKLATFSALVPVSDPRRGAGVAGFVEGER